MEFEEIKKIDTVFLEKFKGILKKCTLCPHKCLVNRLEDQKGFCGAGAVPIISSVMAHHGEEPPVSGTNGSGTVFFAYCNMGCVYCQNYQISQKHHGNPFTSKGLAEALINLYKNRCHNINLVSPTIWIPRILESFLTARSYGLHIPLLYNTGGYESLETIKMLDGIIDIYMPDIRYSSNEMAERYSGAKNYVKHNRLAVKEMYRQVGNLVLDENGIAKKGLLIRLLVLPGNISGTKQALEFIKEEISGDAYLSIMAQYHPEYKACNYPELSRRVNEEEYMEVVDYAEKLGFSNGWTQEYISFDKEDLFRPDFKKKKVFKYYEEKDL